MKKHFKLFLHISHAPVQTFASDLETTIKQTLADVVNVKCKCNFQTESIVEGEFSCIKSRSISYRYGSCVKLSSGA